MILAAAAALTCGVMLGRALLRYRNTPVDAPFHAGDGREFAPERYHVIARLLSDADLRYLEALPGYRKELGARFRRERRRIARIYLGELAADFRKLHSRARKMVAEAPEEHAELVGVLLSLQMRFWRGLAVAEARMVLSPLGLPSVDVRGLMESVEALRLALARATAGPAPLAV
jgi:hypothetical protein